MIRPMRTRLVAAAGALAFMSLASAGELDNPDRGCDGNTYQIVECQKGKLKLLEERLAAAYAKALQMAEPKQRKQLETAQHAWLEFRDADCDYYELGGGTFARIEAGYCMLDLTRGRAHELEQAVEP